MFEINFSVPYFGIDERRRVKPEILAEFFQETAARHASSVGIGVENLMERDLTWVLRRYRINLHGAQGERDIMVKTWFEPLRNLMSVRVFEALTPDGKKIADAWSAWIVLDLKKLRPVRLDRALPEAYFGAADPTGEPLSDKLPETGSNHDYEAIFKTRRRELDLNGHANHTVYFDWALESIPDEVIAGYSPVRFDAEYISSVKRENALVRTKQTSADPLCFSHTIFTEAANTESARVFTEWRRSG